MGFFDFLSNRKNNTNIEVVPDRIWMTVAAKLAGISDEVHQRSMSETVAILLVAHFPDVLAQMEQIALQQAGRAPVKALLASNLNADLATQLDLDASAIIDIIIGERHPLPSADDRIEAFAEQLPCRCRCSRHISLEDPVIALFAGKSVQSMLGKLGMTEHESIQSSIVSRRIRQAQQKIEGKAYGNSDAESAARWLEKNCPELLHR